MQTVSLTEEDHAIFRHVPAAKAYAYSDRDAQVIAERGHFYGDRAWRRMQQRLRAGIGLSEREYFDAFGYARPDVR